MWAITTAIQGTWIQMPFLRTQKGEFRKRGRRRFTHIPYVISQGWFRLFFTYYVPLATFTAAFINAVRMPRFVFSFAHICRETRGGEPAQSAEPRSPGGSSGYILRERRVWRHRSCTRWARGQALVPASEPRGVWNVVRSDWEQRCEYKCVQNGWLGARVNKSLSSFSFKSRDQEVSSPQTEERTEVVFQLREAKSGAGGRRLEQQGLCLLMFFVKE